jgi:hypothetical protein
VGHELIGNMNREYVEEVEGMYRIKGSLMRDAKQYPIQAGTALGGTL